MSENVEAERHLSQTAAAALSVSLNLALQMQVQRAERARIALQESEIRQREAARRLAAERETAAVLWDRARDSDWIKRNPEQLAQAWASARSWESIDSRAAETRERLERLLLAAYGESHPLAELGIQTNDFSTLADLLQRALDAEPADTRHYEVVPSDERQAWLERQVWGPDTDEETRIVRAAELAKVESGVPVAVLREMDAETRAAWAEMRAMPPQERRRWREAWLQREIWGPEGTPDDVRAQRAAALADLREPQLAPGPWNAWVVEVRARLEQAQAEAWDQLRQLPWQEQVAWRNAWLQREIDGSGNLSAAERAERAEAVEVLARSEAMMPLEPEAARSWIAEVRERLSVASVAHGADGGVAVEAAPQATPSIRSGAVVADDSTPQGSANPVETAEERLARTKAVVSAEWPAEIAEAVTQSEAFPAFAWRLHQLEGKGWPMADMLARVPAHRLVGTDRYGRPVEDSAAFGEYFLRQLVESLPTREDTAAGIERLEAYVAEHAGEAEQQNTEVSNSRPEPTPESSTLVRGAAQPQVSERQAAENAERAIRAVWGEEADWIINGNSGSFERLAERLDRARRVGYDPEQFLLEALHRSTVARVTQPNSAVGESVAVDPREPWVQAGVPDPGEPGTNPAALAAVEVGRLSETLGVKDAFDALNAAAVDVDREGQEHNTANQGREAAADPATAPEIRAAELGVADEHQAAAEHAGSAADEHTMTEEELYWSGAYERGAPAAQLAGEGYPRNIGESLAAAKKGQGGRQGTMPAAARVYRTPGQERSR
jgi:hypothetical protein